MYLIYLIFSDFKGIYIYIGKWYMYLMNLLIICKKEWEVLYWDYRYEILFLVYVDCLCWVWIILLVNLCILII